MPDSAGSTPSPLIESRILLIRGHKVLLDRDLARLYQVKAIALRQQVRRNPKRFPPDFLFELDEPEIDALLSQNVIPSRRSLGGARPLAFTEQGIAMLSSVLIGSQQFDPADFGKLAPTSHPGRSRPALETNYMGGRKRKDSRSRPCVKPSSIGSKRLRKIRRSDSDSQRRKRLRPAGSSDGGSRSDSDPKTEESAVAHALAANGFSAVWSALRTNCAPAGCAGVVMTLPTAMSPRVRQLFQLAVIQLQGAVKTT